VKRSKGKGFLWWRLNWVPGYCFGLLLERAQLGLPIEKGCRTCCRLKWRKKMCFYYYLVKYLMCLIFIGGCKMNIFDGPS
jgi:hypothetical protein